MMKNARGMMRRGMHGAMVEPQDRH
jgi:hypothetical protein